MAGFFKKALICLVGLCAALSLSADQENRSGATTQDKQVEGNGGEVQSSSSSAQGVGNKEEGRNTYSVGVISEGLGHIVYGNLSRFSLDLDYQRLAKGVVEASEGKPAPISSAQCLESFAFMQKAQAEKVAKENLAKANSYMAVLEEKAKPFQEAKANDWIRVEPNKLYCQVQAFGDGPEVKEGDSPLLRYQGRTLGGQELHQGMQEHVIPLEEMPPGLKRGLLGLKEGTKCALSMHPELVGYGLSVDFPPNSAMIFEVEILKANDVDQSDGQGDSAEVSSSK